MAIFRFWRHFIALETDFAATTRYVELSADNFDTYSVEFTKLLLAIGSEVDVVCQDVCKAIEPGSNYEKISQYRDCISVRNTVYNAKVTIPHYGLEFQPWKEWHGDTNPPWWRAYQDVKHYRSTHYKFGNLGNCATALAGLFAMVLYCHKAENSQDIVDPLPKLLDWRVVELTEIQRVPYILPYHVYAFLDPFDKSKVPLT